MPTDTDEVGRGRPGRPLLHDDDEVLTAALAAFAEAGYEAMSLRSLGRTLGLSHGALNQRFGSKDALFRAAVEHGFGGLAQAMADHGGWPVAPGVDGLRLAIRAFLLASADRPQIMRLMNTLGITGSERLDHVYDRFVVQMVEPLRRAAEAGVARGTDISTRELFFLVAHGGPAAFTLRGLSDHFDGVDGRLEPVAYAEHMATVLVRTLGG